MQKIIYSGKTEISNLICRGYEIHISDFEYTSKDGITYLMIINNKGYDGDWHVIQSLEDNKLYATDNLWSWNNKNKFNSIVIKTQITKKDITQNYNEILYINNLNFFNNEKLQQVKNDCETSIKIHFENEYIKNNKTRHLMVADDCSRLEIYLYSKPISKNNSLKNFYVHYGSVMNYGWDFEDKYDTIDIAVHKCIELINDYYNDITFDDDEEIFSKLLQSSANYFDKNIMK